MRKESATIRKCHSRLSSLGLDSTVAFHKSKLILKIYRDVVWVLSERAQELQEYAWELGDQDLSTGLCYLENFAPDIDLQDFEEKVCCVMEVKKMICGYIIKKVSVCKDYDIKIEFNINVEQFLNGIDGVSECDTSELSIAQ